MQRRHRGRQAYPRTVDRGAVSSDGLEFDAPDFDGDALIVSALFFSGGWIKKSKGASEGGRDHGGMVFRPVRVFGGDNNAMTRITTPGAGGGGEGGTVAAEMKMKE